MKKQSWMAQLVRQYKKIQQLYPDDKLMIIFDIDGTILDMRYMVLRTLWAYDRSHGTHFFHKLRVADIVVHENHVNRLLEHLVLPLDMQTAVLSWYKKHRWSSEAILESHRPFNGVLPIIRWFQIQANTIVGLNTGRPSIIREDTLRSLNALGQEYRVQFEDKHLYMNPGQWEEGVTNSKVAGIRHFQKMGYRIFALIDNEPDNLTAVAKCDPNHEILLLHANTIFESKRARLPSRSVRGKKYDLTELISENTLPQRVQFVWHGVNDMSNLRQFLTSDIRWLECDVHIDPTGNQLILRHDSFTETPLKENEDWLTLNKLLAQVKKHSKLVKLDLKAGGILIDKILDLVNKYEFEDEHLWFNGNVERLQEHRIRQLAEAHPKAIVQCPVDFLAPLICSAPMKAKEILDMFTTWGVNRFSISWQTNDMRQLFDQMDRWGFEVNIYNVTDLESFLQAVLLMPHSVTSDYNFPKWHYYGQGSGEKGEHYEYSMRKVYQA